jgi:N-acetylglutamate synthase-like GNAT family acetyltransferase
MVDAAMVRWLVIAESARVLEICAALVGAARKAAHTRGARRLYALNGNPLYMEHFGFERVPAAEMLNDLAGTAVANYLRARPDELARVTAQRLDISRDGIIER